MQTNYSSVQRSIRCDLPNYNVANYPIFGNRPSLSNMVYLKLSFSTAPYGLSAHGVNTNSLLVSRFYFEEIVISN